MKQIDATIYFGSEGAKETTTIWVDDNASDSDIENALREEAFSYIEFDWREA